MEQSNGENIELAAVYLSTWSGSVLLQEDGDVHILSYKKIHKNSLKPLYFCFFVFLYTFPLF